MPNAIRTSCDCANCGQETTHTMPFLVMLAFDKVAKKTEIEAVKSGLSVNPQHEPVCWHCLRKLAPTLFDVAVIEQRMQESYPRQFRQGPDWYSRK